ncbi:MarR family transcriptional regulator [Streptomyces sp. ME01-18a]|uniref:MarR family transcriptional regulator n=1 Tax=Streptomyces sp. ME01-18a TaxID=3028669 RepID=UPI0029B7CA2C|nr:MarR family transcriptional regulator [Streptomyces sp. ME01-18a]MDX3430018.1 MarR family transcriptional regulator [Streptomyces sp. ME01-18a]
MATEHLSSALRAPASSRPYAKARPGYGKRTATGQRAPRPDDFALMPERERHIAGYVDRLPDGAAMDIKSLAKSLPLYGQMAVSSALKALGAAGHLRRVRCLAGEGEQVRWVSRTYWSRTARDNEWWDTFLAAEGSNSPPESTPAPPAADADAEAPAPAPTAPASAPSVVPEQRTQATPAIAASPAYLTLAQLGRRDTRLALSAADCRTLEPLAASWFARGVDADYLTQALTAGLPAQVGSPVGLVRRRLTDKLPPLVASSPTPTTTATPKRRLLAECTECGRPGAPEALPDGLCRACRTTPPEVPTTPPAKRDVHALVGQLRDLTRLP